MPLERARSFARAWGARFLEVGRCGHLNAESGHGAWPEGEALLGELERAATSSLRARGPFALKSAKMTG